jgi:hypothetical protein
MTKVAKTVTALEVAINTVYVARRDRVAHPEGNFDRQGRWYPDALEDADGFTRGIRSPSCAWPYSYMLAARTRKHIKALAELQPEYVLRLAREIAALSDQTQKIAA